MTGFGKRPTTITPFLLGLALLVAATIVGCGKTSPPAPQAAVTSTQPAQTSTQPAPTGTVSSVAYDDGRRTLVVTLGGGTTFEYTAVPREVYVGIMAAPARDQYFTTYVRDRYPYRLITSGPAGSVHIQVHESKPAKPPRSSRGRGRGR